MRSTDSYTIAWRCWYNDGTDVTREYSSLNSTLESLPDNGFQAMRLWYSNGRGRYMTGYDYCIFAEHPEGLIFGQTNDDINSIIERYQNVIIKNGTYISDEEFHNINELMINSTNPLLEV